MANPLNGNALRLEFLRAQFWDRYLVYINDLPEGLTMSAKLFADDTSLF